MDGNSIVCAPASFDKRRAASLLILNSSEVKGRAVHSSSELPIESSPSSSPSSSPFPAPPLHSPPSTPASLPNISTASSRCATNARSSLNCIPCITAANAPSCPPALPPLSPPPPPPPSVAAFRSSTDASELTSDASGSASEDPSPASSGRHEGCPAHLLSAPHDGGAHGDHSLIE